MDTYQVFSVLYFVGTFILALLTYLDRHNKEK